MFIKSRMNRQFRWVMFCLQERNLWARPFSEQRDISMSGVLECVSWLILRDDCFLCFVAGPELMDNWSITGLKVLK